ncbi:D-mannonate dehydratase [Rhizobium sp. PP-F2F-G38]|uniref:Mannonate dehydratase n=1 Tax=Ferranicluibacter rubi TaxID=2715133 RepID=A0AA44CD83_9HYPH|nr:mannonate dehydratase [Ferranicluibacter rubi]PYE31736.1 D-mannonate dehydratase [Rhizobium sp. PP-WC-1G-195]PYE93624.1 D-mannonate dehydratase [Rhizobium sp. PP-F2F-G38]TCP77977.1 D-mannonate dehydratase [Rhizobium sp. PP-CC-2G-626]TCP99852.1 D-mannonate dehydratase [Rhizobium sp. PP-F2F-G36]NHT78963.1 mannonate dehydratase [Ferranicluibacter rubi]
MLESWRWFGNSDPVTLSHARQAGAHGVVTALHHIYDGRAWSVDDILDHKATIERAGMAWSVCESIPVNSAIKLRNEKWRQYVDSWKDSLANLGHAGIPVVCYNFMPVVDWTRTNLRYPTAAGGLALRFDMADFAAYDLFVLKRRAAEENYQPALIETARQRFEAMSDEKIQTLETNIIAGLPGKEGTHTREGIRAQIASFDDLSSDDMRANLLEFLTEIVPVAAEYGVRLGIHPDDPPFSLFGLPRIVSDADDIATILGAVNHDANGITLCAGSYGSRAGNDLTEMATRFASRVHFAHLRNVRKEADGSFIESDHLDGDVNMVSLVAALRHEERRREAEGRADSVIPFRPDHGHLLIDDQNRTVNPGYSCIGRLKGLAELRGVIAAVDQLEHGIGA